jgi:methylmalonyl-CoA/ethylmalonyl-CoA epimerase
MTDAKQTEKKVALTVPDQIGIIVKDVDKAVAFYRSTFGWSFVTYFPELEFTFRGEIGKAKLKVAMTQVGPLEIELIEVLEGETAHSEWLREHGGGLHHLRFPVEDYDATWATLADAGMENIFSQHRVRDDTKRGKRSAIKNAYIDHKDMGGAVLEIFEMKEEDLPQ